MMHLIILKRKYLQQGKEKEIFFSMAVQFLLPLELIYLCLHLYKLLLATIKQPKCLALAHT